MFVYTSFFPYSFQMHSVAIVARGTHTRRMGSRVLSPVALPTISEWFRATATISYRTPSVSDAWSQRYGREVCILFIYLFIWLASVFFLNSSVKTFRIVVKSLKSSNYSRTCRPYRVKMLQVSLKKPENFTLISHNYGFNQNEPKVP